MQAFSKILGIDKFNKDIFIYIESIKGEEYAKKLYEQGYKGLYITTGYPRHSFNAMPWIKAVVGKDVPF